jgi:tripartite-type tricarboxylate transporter receptor subunit TctC
MHRLRIGIALSGCLLGSLAWSSAADAQTYPARPMTLIIPFAAGGPTDVLGRVMAARMGEILGQQMIVENVAAGGGQVGSKRVADAAPDGYMIGLGTVGTHAQGQTLYKKPLYNSQRDFTPVVLIADVPIVLAGRKDLPVKDFREFVAYTKANQGKMSYGTGGTGSAPHLGCMLLNHTLGTDVTHVPYRGTGPATQDLLGGRIDFMCAGITTAKPLIDDQSLKGLAIFSSVRSPVMPDLATAVEQGVKVEAYTWNALFLPKATPDVIVRTLNAAAVAAMKTPAVRDKLAALGAQVVSDEQATPQYLGQFVKSETEKWAGPIKASGMQVD